MSASFSEVTKRLLAGQSVAWQKFGDHKAGSIRLEKPEQRRLLEFLLNADPDKIASGDESLFTGLVAAWENNKHDPANVAAAAPISSGDKSWRLTRVEASGFGGLTIFGGKSFDLYVGGHNWCLEGQNGSGKTSLVSAILWALTGYRIREHEGPVLEQGLREDVDGEDGKRIGTWPPLAAYPTKVADLQKSAEVWVPFASSDGSTVTAFRRIVSPAQGAPTLEEEIDPAIVDALRLAEIGILMPARITKVGFGKSSLTLYEAVKQLTGLDRLSDIADGCAAFGAANRKFMKYAKDNRIDLHENRFYENIEKAKQSSLS
ncbi:ATP-binding protein [Bradyrhizobium sp. LMG 9283]|uniref:ATP-binding protein n=1 Tax=Bradyrhizobium sp. LMG 9283 TaxID=592064 RepID=UPI0038906B8A